MLIDTDKIAPFSVALSDKAEMQLIDLAKAAAKPAVIVCKTGREDMPYMILHGILRLAITREHNIELIDCQVVETKAVLDGDTLVITDLGP